jgi:tRNA A37 threonylcarbamoyladenosine synthetase subunit TsaC/SUA5/YrdC
VVAYFGNQLDVVLDGGPRRGAVPSTLVDVSGPQPKLLRRGELDVTAALGEFEDLSSRSG